MLHVVYRLFGFVLHTCICTGFYWLELLSETTSILRSVSQVVEDVNNTAQRPGFVRCFPVLYPSDELKAFQLPF